MIGHVLAIPAEAGTHAACNHFLNGSNACIPAKVIAHETVELGANVAFESYIGKYTGHNEFPTIAEIIFKIIGSYSATKFAGSYFEDEDGEHHHDILSKETAIECISGMAGSFYGTLFYNHPMVQIFTLGAATVATTGICLYDFDNCQKTVKTTADTIKSYFDNLINITHEEIPNIELLNPYNISTASKIVEYEDL